MGGYAFCGNGSVVSPAFQIIPPSSTFIFEFVLLCLALYQSTVLYKEAGRKLKGIELVTVLVMDQVSFFIA